tara:strand:- start:19 stop:1527 length:1509 start_codon:yes stop_codon:yes gene_type:complete
LSKYSFKNSFLSFIIKARINKINAFIRSPIITQNNTLKSIIKKASNTEFGQEHNFNQIKDYNSFIKNIPVRKYEEMSKYIQKCRDGKKNILWPDKIKWYAKSSGTTNASSKYIPITKDSLFNSHLKAGKDMLSLYENNFPTKNIYNGKGIMLCGSLYKSKKNTFIDGDLSAILVNEFPFWVNYHKIPSTKIALMNNWEKKIEEIVNQSINSNITNLTGVPSWMIIILQRVLHKTKKKNLLEVWPNLELYIHGGINFDPYKKIFEELIPSSKMNYMEGYNASEGFFAIQDENKSKGMLLMLNYGIFYEFIPMSSFKMGERTTISLNDVKKNINYAIVITTNGGLFRYLIGDVIKFISINPHRIIITGRTKNYINTFGEELIIENTDSAIIKTSNKLNCIVREYTVAPIFINKNSGGHEWLIEFEKAPTNINDFKIELDKNLRKLNSDYDAKRYKDIIIKELKINVLRNNEFYKWLKRNNRLGGQFKIPRLSNDRKIINEILNL